MIYPIYTYGQDILRTKAEDIDIKDPNLTSIILDMYQTMHNAKGVGLTAPQIGINKKLIVIDEEIADGQFFRIVLLNPKILSYAMHTNTMSEGCLSLPGISVQINRPAGMDVEWYDEDGKYHRKIFTGVPARILQHEIDHLDGTLFTDRIHPVDKMKIFMQLEDIKNKKVETSYLIL